MKKLSFDRELAFSLDQVLDNTANTGSSNELDLGSAQMGEGTPVTGVVNVTALSGTLVIKVCGKASASVSATDLIYTLPTVSAGVTGQYHFTLPQDAPRYIKLFYSAGTSGTVTAWLN